jgi:type IV pilus assembly protein PilB
MEEAVKMTKNLKRRKRLGECLIEAGLIDEEVLAQALSIQKVRKKKLGQILIDMGVVDDEGIARVLSTQLKIPLLHLRGTDIPKETIALVSAELAETYLLIPVKETNKKLLVAIANPLEFYALDDLRFVTQMPIEIAIAPQNEILEAIEKYYPKQDLEKSLSLGPGLGNEIEFVHQESEEEDKNVQDLKNLSSLPPIIRFVNTMLADAIRLKASDVHIEPQKTAVMIRYRVDGVLREIMKTDRHVHASLVSRIKVISNMDISIRRKPQDGRTQVRVSDKSYDLRVSTIPTSYGEKVTIRILDQSGAGRQLDDLELSEKQKNDFHNALTRPQGIILVTGPTGSGKTSTLYACLNRLNTPKVNIVTVEDPIEFDIPGVNQVQIHPQAGITFASGLRSILRQDPDIVMVGEIRDPETATIAFQASQTGHLVLSTLHTNDAPSSVVRLIDLGVQGFMISASLICVVAQRLVRKICPKCKAPDPLSAKILQQLAPFLSEGEEMTFWKGTGCELCQFTGYSGRMGIFEVLNVTPSLKEIITSETPAITIKNAAEREGYEPLFMDGIRKARLGWTTIEEVYRVAPPDAEEDRRRPSDRKPLLEIVEPRSSSATTAIRPISIVRSKKILVAEDNEVTLKLLCNFLEAENYQPITAKDGVEALKLAVQEKPDLIITDCIMPEMDGVTLIQKLRAQPTTRYIPIVMITVDDDVDSEIKAIDAGADDYITKPVNAKKLMARVNRLLSKPAASNM